MRLAAALISTIILSGCVVTKQQLLDPYVVSRVDSTKSAEDFAACVAGRVDAEVRSERNSTFVILKNQRGVHVARWDFITTNGGSQAELRASGKYDPRLEAVRSCA